MTLPKAQENTNTATPSNHLSVDEKNSRENGESVSPASDCGTKRPFDEDATTTTETDTRAKRARTTPADSPTGTLPVEQANIDATSTVSATLSSAPPEPPSDHVPSGDVSMADSSLQPHDAQEEAPENPATESTASGFLNLPFDVLAEILILTEYPGDILAVARTSKHLCTQLVSPAAGFVWKKARTAVGLPDLSGYEPKGKNLPGINEPLKGVVGVGRFLDREPAYAAFVFDGGVCEVCGKSTDRMYASFSLRFRLCENPECRKQMKIGFAPTDLTWIPVVESGAIFGNDHVAVNWPSTTVTRRSLILEDAEDHECIQNEQSFLQKMVFEVARNNVWMQFCLGLYRWRTKWESQLRSIKQHNEVLGKDFAEKEGWNYSNMVADTSYGQFHEDKRKRRERIEGSELEEMRPTIARELLQAQEKKHQKTVMKLQQTNLNSIWKFYQKLLSRRTEYPYLPSFSVFLQLPAIQLLQSSDLATAELSVKAAVGGKKTGTFMNNMVKQQIDRWAEGVKREMLENLGGSSEWNKLAPTRRMPHPVLRLDARWRCRICDSVETKYEIDECLDFAGVCRHECREKDGMKRKKGSATQAWSTSNFVKDEQACAIMKACLSSVESTNKTRSESEAVEETRRQFHPTTWQCSSCDPPLLVRAGSIIGHSHRHPFPMKAELAWTVGASMVKPLNQPGTAQWLKHGSKLSKEWSNKNNYGCQHCANLKVTEERAVEEQAMLVDGPPHSEPHDGPQTTSESNAEKGQASAVGTNKEKKKKQFENRFNFNGLRSHLSSKHKIYRIRDEDFFCHRAIKFPTDTLLHLIDSIMFGHKTG